MWKLSVDMKAAPRESRMQNNAGDIGVRRASNKKRYQNLQSIMQAERNRQTDKYIDRQPRHKE
ncbi:hypothetical protein DPMN_192961 [Dreissena polymorpha]|uniref:Uncharacterized protein n=1 Tax=Dreissena polymorpha TaxID=45954 RepID=A0A9D3Y0H4_DREPO|nr:hypothetical protein DPMN_192961 [Dreissena polymorpha]